MSVWYRQTSDGRVTDGPRTVAPHTVRQSDRALLVAKANGAADKGWAVEWTGPRSFTATKDRWGGVLCIREFWIEG